MEDTQMVEKQIVEKQMADKQWKKRSDTWRSGKSRGAGKIGILFTVIILSLLRAGVVCAHSQTNAPKYPAWWYWYDTTDLQNRTNAQKTVSQGDAPLTEESISQSVSAGDWSVQVEIKGLEDKGKLTASVEDVDGLYVFDISFLDENGSPRKVEGVDALVRIGGLAETQAPDGIYYINDQGVREDISDSLISGGNGEVVFRTTHFSKYAILYAARVEAARVEAATNTTARNTVAQDTTTQNIAAQDTGKAVAISDVSIVNDDSKVTNADRANNRVAPATGENNMTLWAWMGLALAGISITLLRLRGRE